MRLLATVVLGAALSSIPSREVLPARNQALLLLRVLSYDRNLRARSGDELTVVVAFREGETRSEQERDAMGAALEEAARSFTVSGLKARVVTVPWRGAPALAAELKASGAAALYVGQSLSGEAAAISAATRTRSTLSFAPLREMIEQGLALGLVNSGNRARLLVNLPAARDEGADLDSVFLGIVEVIGKSPTAPR